MFKNFTSMRHFLFFFDYSLQLLIFFVILFFSVHAIGTPIENTQKSHHQAQEIKKKKENKIATNVIDFAKKHTGMYHEIFHPVGC